MAISPYLSIITLNVNGLNSPIKGRKLAKWIRKQDLAICCIQKFTDCKDMCRLKVKGFKR